LNKKSVILSHSGKQHSYHVADALNKLEFLEKFYTSSYITNLTVQQLVRSAGLTYLTRRFLPGLGSPHVQSNWKYELKEIIYRKLKGNSRKVNDLVFERDMNFDKSLAKKLDKLNYDIFWGFQGSCFESLKKANKMGKVSVCEMTIAHLPFTKKILDEEALFHPDWADSIDFTSFPSEYESRLINEPHIASKVIAISSFLKQTLVSDSIPEDKISVIPLGFDVHKIPYNEKVESLDNRPLRLLYAGRVTQRKGIKYLLDAMSAFKTSDVELHIIGNIHGSGNAFKKYTDSYTYSAGVSQNELFKMYGNYDALVFPSIVEGFGLVTIEAMGAGLPVITTPNTNAMELIRDGENGFLIPIRDVHAITEAITRLRNLNDPDFQKMRACARKTALLYTWQAHQQKISEFVDRIKN